MGLIKDKLNGLKETDLYSVILFALAKLRDTPEYSALSELFYILDKDSMIKLCQIFGGVTITVPTIEELELITYALLIYEYVDVNGLNYTDAIKNINNSTLNMKDLKDTYIKIKDVLAKYELSSRSV